MARRLKQVGMGLLAGTIVLLVFSTTWAQGTWATKAPMPSLRGSAAVGVIGNKLYVAGGINDSGYLDKLEVYNPATDTWETKAPMPTPRAFAAAGVIDNKLYVVGGQNTGINLATMVVYDPVTDTWDATRTPMPAPREGIAIGVIENKLYVVGGNTTDQPLATMVVYDPVTNTWDTTKSPMPTARFQLSSGVIDNKLYVVGGTSGSPSPTAAQTAVEMYDPTTDTWTIKTSMPTGRHALGVGIINNRLYAVGGFLTPTTYLNTVEEYNPASDTWAMMTAMPTTRRELGAGVIQSKLYAVGGYNPGSGRLSTVEEFTPPTPPQFTEVGASAGVNDDRNAHGVAWGDYNNDGFLDLYVANTDAGPNRLYRNNGDGTFTEVGASAGVNDTGNSASAAWGDYNNDGNLDLYVANAFPPAFSVNRLYRNNGDGTFTEVGASAGVNDSGDGRGTAWGDYNNDGFLDLYVANTSGGTNRLYRNNGDGTFTEVGANAGVNDSGNSAGVAWGDYNNDGRLDLYVVKEFDPNRLYRNNGDGTFAEVGASAGVNGNGRTGVAWGDYNNDGYLDLYVVSSLGVSDQLYRNNGNGTFTEVGASAGVDDGGNGFGVTWGDYDNDGDLDLYVSNDGSANRLYRNNGDGTFTDVAASAGVNNVGDRRGVAWGDYDNDGDLDLYVGSAGLTPANFLYRNNGTLNRWLEVKLVGTVSNKSGIGAQVITITGATQQRRDVDGGSGFGSQPSLPVEFGFGSTITVDSLIIRWPSGIVQRLTNAATNQVLTVTESTLPPHITVTPPTLDFGTVLVQNSGSATLMIRNLGTADLSVTAITHTNLVFSVNTPFTVAPGDSHVVTVTFHPTTVGTERDTLVIESNDPDTPHLRIPLVGVGHPGPFSLQADDVSAAPGSLALVRLRLQNARMAVGALQFVLQADPALLRPSPEALILHTRAAGFTVSSVYDTTTGELRVVLFSLTNAVIDTGSGSMLDIPSTLSASAPLGGQTALDLRMTTQNGQFATTFSDRTGARAITPFDLVDGSVRFGFRGDVNFDRIVNVLDIVQAVQIILGIAALDPAKVVFFDINMDETINVLDLVGMVNLILNGPQPKVIAGPTSPVAVSLDNVQVVASGQLAIPVMMQADGVIAGVQATFTFDPAQLQVGTPQLVGQAVEMTITSQVTDGTLRLVIYSMTGQGIAAGSGPVFLIPMTVSGEPNTSPTLTLSQVVLANHQAQAVPVMLGSSTVKVAALPTAFALKPNRPNPFNPTTQIAYDVPQAAHITLAVYNLLGQEVVRLVDEVKAPGRYIVTWDGRNGQGLSVASGVYLCRLTTSTGFSQTRRMTLVK